MPFRATKPFVTSALLIAGFAACLVADLPGHLSYDSVIQLMEGRSGAYWGWHPPAMSWLLGVFDALMPGTTLFVVFDAALFFGSLLALVWLRPPKSWAAAGMALLIAASPIALLYQGIVWKDVLFADTAVAGFTALAFAAARWAQMRLRSALIVAGLLLLCLATLARQNGVLVLGSGIAAVGWIAARHASKPARALVFHAATMMVFAALLITSANVALGWRIIAPSGQAKQVRLLQLYDIIGFVAADRTLALDELHAHATELEREVRRDGVRLYNPERNDPLAASQALQDALNAAPWNVVRGQWFDLIVHHPLIYAHIRLEVFRWVFATPDIRVCLPYLVGVSGPQGPMRTLHLAERDDDRDEALSAYTAAFIQTPVLSHVFYALLAIACAALLFIRRRDADIAIAMQQVGALLFGLSFLVIGIACDYRYLYALDVAALAGAFYLALDMSGFRRPAL